MIRRNVITAPGSALALALTVFSLAAPLTVFSQEQAAKPPATVTQSVPYKHEKVAMEGRMIKPNPAAPSLPLIVLFPDWMGVSQRAMDDAKRLAVKGYAVFVADPYGVDLTPRNAKQAAKVSGALKNDVMQLRKVAATALAAARRQQGVDTARVALLGFCFGGAAALELARSGADLRGTAVVHGNLKTTFPEDARNIKGRVLVLHGGADPHVPPDEVTAFRAQMAVAQVDLNFVEYPGAMHAFTNPKAADSARGLKYHPQAAEAAFGELERFFAEVFAP